jgi:hypothetical protein
MDILDGIKSWQRGPYAMNPQAKDDLSLWLQCIRPYGGSSMLTDAIRNSTLHNPQNIVVITDGMFEMTPDILYQVSIFSSKCDRDSISHFLR